MKIFITNNSSETQRLGEDFSRILKGGEIIALYGDLGSGKTTFVQGVARGLGIKRRIISPTFIIVRSYKINIKYQISNIKNTNKKLKTFYHIDLYRIEGEKDIENLGIEEIIKDSQNIVAIEWAEKMGKLLPKDRIDIRFATVSENERRITINIKYQKLNIKNTG